MSHIKNSQFIKEIKEPIPDLYRLKALPLYEEFGVSGGISYDDHVILDKSIMGWFKRDNSFFPTKKPNKDSIPPGLYDIRNTMEEGLHIVRRDVMLDELFMLPDDNMMAVVDDLTKFWTRKDKYKEYGITYKRGILLYGPPGTGKSSLLNITIKRIIDDYSGIVLNVDSLSNFIPMVQLLRTMEPDKPILAVIEDIDSFLYNNSTKDFLNVLDGNLQVDNIVYIATTNYIDQLEPRIINRPSRFDRKIEIGYPNAEARRLYISKKLKAEDLAKIELEKWVKDTENLTISHIKELIISVAIMDNDYNETLKLLKEMFYIEPTNTGMKQREGRY